jgi:hypothetical protein
MLLPRITESLLIISLFSLNPAKAAATSALLARGYTVLPQPQQSNLRANDFRFAGEWKVEIGNGVAPDSIAAEVLREELRSRFSIHAGSTGSQAVRRTETRMQSPLRHTNLSSRPVPSASPQTRMPVCSMESRH